MIALMFVLMAGVGLAVVVIALASVAIYNNLVQSRVACDTAWSNIDVQLKRRHDLIPNLVETVKGYAAHEKGTLEDVTRYRAQAMQATTPDGKAAAENQLSGALSKLVAVAENYPDLKASQQFTQLQSALSQTEDFIQISRSGYNTAVQTLNTNIQSFPASLLAGMFGFQQRQFFATTDADREPVAIKF
jgi:LemA protein